MPDASTPDRRHHPLLPWLAWLGILVVLTIVFLPLRTQIEKLSIALTFLLVVLGGSASSGRPLGLTLATIAYFDFHYFFVERYNSLVMEKPLDWLVLFAFLVTSVVAEQLLTRANERADEARQRAEEVERLAALGSETLHAGRAEDALARILEVIRTELRVDHCDIVERSDVIPRTEPWPDARTLIIPLIVRGHHLGLLRLSHSAPIALAPAQRRFVEVLSYYAALGLERVRLVADAERAESFRQADALKSAMIAGFSHDLRTPLTTIKALASNLKERDVAEGASIEEEADRLTRLVTDLLDLSRLDAKAMPIRLELNMADDLIGAAVRQFATTAARARITIPGPSVDSEPLAGQFDFVHALRAYVNLVENALKYSPATMPVELGARRRDEFLEFLVSDRGPGIPEQERERVFEPFYRAPGVRADIGGAGLGLAIARRLAREQGGDVSYAARDGGGSVLSLTLRAADLAL